MASKAYKMIELGRKPSKGSEVSAPKADSTYYPSLSLSPDEAIDFPKGEFMARVRMKLKNSNHSEDENGKKRHTYSLDVCCLHPEFEKAEKEADEESTEGDTDDAATRIMKSMGRARAQKVSAEEDEE